MIDGYDKVVDADLEDGSDLFLDVLRQAAPKSLYVQVQAGMTDVAQVMQEEGELFVKKVAIVSVQAGLQPADTLPETSLSPTPRYGWSIDSSQNNVYDKGASQHVFDFCFDKGLEMRVVSRHA